MILPVPRRTASRVLAVSLAAAAGAWVLGEQGVRVGPWTLASWDWTYLAAGAVALLLVAPIWKFSGWLAGICLDVQRQEAVLGTAAV